MRNTNGRATHTWLALGVALALVSETAAGLPAAESNDGVWRDFDEKNVQLRGEREIVPLHYRTVELDWSALNGVIATAPSESDEKASEVDVVLSLPLPNGSFARFRILESPIMAPELAAAFPEIRTYRGQGIDDPDASLRFDATPAGFHAMILSPTGRVFIDPYSTDDTERYISYYTHDYPRPEGLEFECGFDQVNPWTEAAERPAATPAVSSGTELRTYRTAVAATGEYTQFHGGTVPAGQAAIVTAMNRVNGIYEREVAIRMVLVANNSDVVFTNSATDGYTNNNGFAMLGQNQSTLDSVIGSANYDIGHVFSTGGGGVAYLGVACEAGFKAQGVTGLSSPVGDVFYVDYVAHELGHQWGATHTFNGSSGNCSGSNRTASTAYEPGSGSTIMAYAGICSPQNIQSNSDDYFHAASFDQIASYSTVGQGDNCDAPSATGNNPPTVDAGPSWDIPVSTPFTLCGSASDPNGDPLTYGWEEFDKGPAGHPNTPSGNAPIFRSFDPVLGPCRTFPQWSDILGNTQTIGEILPTYSRTMNFRLTVRDNRSGGGGVDSDTTTVSVTDTAGPFLVTSPNTAVSWTGGSTETVTWNVANTDAVPVSCADVDILLSTDGGASFPTTVAAATANDGSQLITVPDVSTTTARLMVACSTGVFFDVSNTDFSIAEGNACLADDAVLTSYTVTGPEVFQAATSITAGPDFTVANGGDATFRAGSHIILNDGFSVVVGGIFSAEITPGVCE